MVGGILACSWDMDLPENDAENYLHYLCGLDTFPPIILFYCARPTKLCLLVYTQHTLILCTIRVSVASCYTE